MKAWQMLLITNVGITVFELVSEKWTYALTVALVTPIPVGLLFWADGMGKRLNKLSNKPNPTSDI